MIAEIISTGDEVLTGTVVDSNAAYIAARLYEIGVPVGRHVCVGDDLDRLSALLREAGGRSNVAIVTGGLGPTVDDITAQAAAIAAGVTVAVNPTAKAYIEAFFKRFNRPMTDSDYKQAKLPVDAQPILNDVGTAPGFKMRIGNCQCFFLPGVPYEMRRMMTETVVPAIEAEYCSQDQKRFYREKRISLFGLPEAHVNERLTGLTQKLADVTLGMVAEFPVIHVKLSAHGSDTRQMDLAIESASAEIYDAVGDYVFSENNESMEEVVGKLLRSHTATLALAESCTGGLIAHRVTNVAGSSDYFTFSAVTYANDAKMKLLGVSRNTLEKFGAVSEETVKEMADGVRRVSGADYGLAVSGVAGPGGGTPEKPVGTVCIGLSGPAGTLASRRTSPFDDRLANKRIFAEAALDALRRQLINANYG